MSQDPVAPDIVVLFSAEDIAERIEELARDIASQLPQDIVAIAVLRGSFMFAADLVRALSRLGMRPETDFLWLSSYGTGTKSSGTVHVVRDVECSVAGRNVLIIDDILESGRTLAVAERMLRERGAKSVSICVLLEKPGKREVAAEARFVGFACPDTFVIGYGLDKAGRYRELPFIAKLQ